MRTIITVFAFALSAGAATANQEAADACKAKLSPTGQEIYSASLAQNPTKSTGRGIVTAEVKKLISAGKVSMSEGRKEGEAAGACLELLQ